MAEGGSSEGATSCPSEQELSELSHQITSFWFDLGIRLKLSSNTLDNIDNNNVRFGSPQRKAFQMLIEWSHRQETFSYQHLSQALRDVGQNKLAQDYCGQYQSAGVYFGDQERETGTKVMGRSQEGEGGRKLRMRLARWKPCRCFEGLLRVSSGRIEPMIENVEGAPMSASQVGGGRKPEGQKIEHCTEQHGASPSRIPGPKDPLMKKVEGQHGAFSSQIPGPKKQMMKEVEEILEDMKANYKRREAFLQPFPWCEHYERTLDNVYTEVKMVGRRKERSQLTDQACSMYDIFQSHAECENPRVVLLEGDPGMGKTVFCQKLTFDWASGKTDGFMADVEVLLKLKCRDLKSSDIKEAIVMEFLPCDAPEEVKMDFLDHIRDTRSKALIVLDGLDELKEGIDLSLLIRGKLFPGCRLLLTSRNNEELRRHCDTLFQVIGFTPKHAKDFIVKYFGDDKVKSSALLDRIGLPYYEADSSDEEESENGGSGYFDEELENDDEGESQSGTSITPSLPFLDSDEEEESNNGGLLSLICSPLNTILICAVFQETEGQLPVHTTHLYQEIVCCIVRIRYKKKGEEPPADPVEKHKEELAALGRLALQGLENDELHFSGNDVQADDPAKNILEFGFLSKQNSTSIFKTQFSYQFLHKTMQEFFAALCLHEQLLSGNLNYCLTYLVQITGFLRFKYKQVALFVAGLLSQHEAGRQLLVDLVSSLTRSLSAVDDDRFSFVYVCDVLRECAECQQQQLQQAVAREFGWEGLNLRGEQLDENSAEYRIVCGVLKKENCPLEELYLDDNNIHDGTLLAESLGVNTSLRFLSLPHNPLTAGSASALARVLSAHPTLELLVWPKEFRGELEGREHRNLRLGIYYL